MPAGKDFSTKNTDIVEILRYDHVDMIIRFACMHSYFPHIFNHSSSKFNTLGW